MQQVTVFERIPDAFVELYDAQFRGWAANFKRVGRVAAFRLKRPVDPLVVARDQRKIVGVRLEAEVDGGRITIRPQTDADAEAIARHVVDMRQAMNRCPTVHNTRR
jgi:hypothetical protein